MATAATASAAAPSSLPHPLPHPPRPDEEHEQWANEVSGVTGQANEERNGNTQTATQQHSAHGQTQTQSEHVQPQQQQHPALSAHPAGPPAHPGYVHLNRFDQEQQLHRLLQQQAQIQAQQNALYLQQQQLHLAQPMYIPPPAPIQFESNLAPPPPVQYTAQAAATTMVDHMHDPSMDRPASRKRERASDSSGGPSSGAQTPASYSSSMPMPDRPYSAAATYRAHDQHPQYMQLPQAQLQMQHTYYQQMQPPPMQIQPLTQIISQTAIYPADDSEQMQKRCRSASYAGAGNPNGVVDGSAGGPGLLLADDGSVRLDADGKPLRRPTMHRRRRTEELLPHEVWTCANIDPETKLPCAKTYRTSSSRSIHKHEAACKFKPPEGSVPPGDGKRKQKTRRKSHELAAHERWNCPFMCGRYFRTTSTKSIHLHRMSCPSRPGGPVAVSDADRVASQAEMHKSLQKQEMAKLGRARDKQHQQQQAAAAGSKTGTRAGSARRAPRKHWSTSESEQSECSEASDEDEQVEPPVVKPEGSPVRRMSFPDLYAPTTAAAATTVPLSTPKLDNFDESVLPALPTRGSSQQQHLPQQLHQTPVMGVHQSPLPPPPQMQPTFLPQQQPMQPMMMHPGGFKIDPPPSAAYASVSAAAAHTAQQIACIQEKLMELQQRHSTGQDSRTVSHELRTLQRSIQHTTQQLAEQQRQQREFEEQRQRQLMQPYPPQLYAPLPPLAPVSDPASNDAAMVRLLMQQKEIETNIALHKAQHVQTMQLQQQQWQQQHQPQQPQQQAQPQVTAAATPTAVPIHPTNPPVPVASSVSPHEAASRPSSSISMHELSNGLTSLSWPQQPQQQQQQQQQSPPASLPPYLPLPGQTAASVSTAQIASGATSMTDDSGRESSVASVRVTAS